MANVGFKLGSQEALDLLLKNGGATAGAFYLTSDTNRLYIGKEGGTIAPVNEGVISVENVNALAGVTAAPGSFYYAKTENVLCVYSKGTWVQINAIVTNDRVSHTAAGAVDENNAAIANTITVTTNVHDSRNGTPASGSFNIKGEDGIVVSGEGSLVTIKGDPITVATSVENNTVTATFKSANNATDGSFELVGGNNITFETVEGKNTIKAKNTYADGITVANASGENATGFDIGAALNDGNTIKTGRLDPKVVLKAVEDGVETEVKFVNGSAVLPVYTASQVDGIKGDLQAEIKEKIRNFNALVYRGIVGTGAPEGKQELPTTNIQIGDAYLVSGTYKIGTAEYPAGTLIVATGEEVEGSDYIEDGKVQWTYVTGSTADTTYFGRVDVGTGALNIYASTDSTGTPVASVNVVAGTTMEVAHSATAAEEGIQIYTVNHKTFEGSSYDTTNSVAAKQMTATETGYKIKAITGITVENGHITDVSSTEYSVLDTNVNLKSEMSASAVDNLATVKLTNTLINDVLNSSSAPIEASFGIKSDSLSIKVPEGDGANVSVNLTWGTF